MSRCSRHRGAPCRRLSAVHAAAMRRGVSKARRVERGNHRGVECAECGAAHGVLAGTMQPSRDRERITASRICAYSSRRESRRAIGRVERPWHVVRPTRCRQRPRCSSDARYQLLGMDRELTDFDQRRHTRRRWRLMDRAWRLPHELQAGRIGDPVNSGGSDAGQLKSARPAWYLRQ